MWNVLRCNCQCNCIAFVQWKWMRVNSPLLGTFQTFRFCSALDLHPLAFLSPSSPNSFCYTSPSQDSKDCRSAAKRALQASNQEVSPGPGLVPAPKNWFRPLHPFSCRDSSIFNLQSGGLSLPAWDNFAFDQQQPLAFQFAWTRRLQIYQYCTQVNRWLSSNIMNVTDGLLSQLPVLRSNPVVAGMCCVRCAGWSASLWKLFVRHRFCYGPALQWTLWPEPGRYDPTCISIVDREYLQNILRQGVCVGGG